MIRLARLHLEQAALLAALALAPPPALCAQEAGGRAPIPAGVSVAPDQPADGPVEGDLTERERTKVRQEVLARLREREVLHRERLATIQRLRELAESQGQHERLAQLDKLEVKEGSCHNNAMTYTAVKLADTVAYKQAVLRLSAGRVRRNAPDEAAPAEPVMTPEERRARREAVRAKKAEKRAAEEQAAEPKGSR